MSTQPSRLRASARGVLALVLLLSALVPTMTTAAPHASPLAAPCTASGAYDPACDVDHDGDVDIMDIQKTAGHWNQTGAWMSDNGHNHLGQTWTGSGNPLTIGGTFGNLSAPLILNNSNGYGLRVGSAGSDGVSVGSAGVTGFAVNNAAYGLFANSVQEVGVLVNVAGNPTTVPALSPGKNGFEVVGAERVGLQVGRADIDGVYVNSAGRNGATVNTADQDGFSVYSAGRNGIHVDAAQDDGVFLGTVGSPSFTVASDRKNGVEVTGAEGYGMYVGRSNLSGVRVYSSGGAGFWSGLATTGLLVEDASNDGVTITSAGDNGVYVYLAGSPSTAFTAPLGKNGFEIAGAERVGLQVGRADVDGVYVNSVGRNGLTVNTASQDGLAVYSATQYGVNVAGGALGGYFSGGIQVTGGGCTGCLLAIFGINEGDTALEPGDLVALDGLQESGVDSVPMLLKVRRAGAGDTVVGVVQGWADLVSEDESRAGEIGLKLAPREGAAQPGQHVTIAYSGMTQVRAQGPVGQSARLTGGSAGARALQSRLIDGMQVTEGAQEIGVALEALEADQGMIWVLLNVQ